MFYYITKKNELYHHGVRGQKWGVRRYQNEDGTLTNAGKQRYANSMPSSAVSAQKAAATQKAQYLKQRYANSMPSSAVSAQKAAAMKAQNKKDAISNLGEVFKSAKQDRVTGYRSDGTYGFTEEYLEKLGEAMSNLENIDGTDIDGYIDSSSISSEMDSFIEKVKRMESVTGEDYEDVLEEAKKAYQKKKQREFEKRQKEYEERMKSNIPSSAWQARIGKSTGVTKDVYKGRIWVDDMKNKMRNSSEFGNRVQAAYNDLFGTWDEYLKSYRR